MSGGGAGVIFLGGVIWYVLILREVLVEFRCEIFF
jgi:hypothetical protein